MTTVDAPASAPASRERAKAFGRGLSEKGFDFFTGVPCSLIKDLILELEANAHYFPENREDAAVGLATGAWLAGRKPCVLMQNSGIGTSLNALMSLALMYEIPLLLIVTYRGRGGKDAPEHLLMGAVCEQLLKTIGIPARVLSPDAPTEALHWADAWLAEKSTPVCLLVPPGLFDGGKS